MSPRVGSKLPLPFYADVRLHIPMTHQIPKGWNGKARKLWGNDGTLRDRATGKHVCCDEVAYNESPEACYDQGSTELCGDDGDGGGGGDDDDDDFLAGVGENESGSGSGNDVLQSRTYKAYVGTSEDQPALFKAGIKLLKSTAIDLGEIRDTYGVRGESTEDILLTMHVVGTDTIPGGVYTYVSRSVYLSLSPTFLVLVGGYPLLPPMKQMLVHFVSEDCNPITYDSSIRSHDGVWNKSSLVYQEKLAQIHHRLREALTPGGAAEWGAQMALKGELVRHSYYRYESRDNDDKGVAIDMEDAYDGKRKHSFKGWWLHPKYMQLNANVQVNEKGSVTFPGGDTNSEVEYIGQHLPAVTVVYLTIIAGALFGFVLEWYFFKWARGKLRERFKESEISYRIGMRGLDAEQQVHNCASSWFIPFEMPIELFKIAFPYQSFISSLPQFFAVYYRPTDADGIRHPKDWLGRRKKAGKAAEAAEEEATLAAQTTSTLKAAKRQVTVFAENVIDRTLPMEGIKKYQKNFGLEHVPTKVGDYRNQGVPLQQFKDKYRAYCFQHMMKEEGDDRQIRKFMIAEQKNPITNKYYGIAPHKLHAIPNVQIDGIAMESLESREQVDVDPQATFDTLCHIVATVDVSTPSYRIDQYYDAEQKQTSSMCNGCEIFSHAEMMHDTGARCFESNSAIFIEMLKVIVNRDWKKKKDKEENASNSPSSIASTASEDEKEAEEEYIQRVWSDIILALFTCMFCNIQGKKSRKLVRERQVEEAPAAKGSAQVTAGDEATADAVRPEEQTATHLTVKSASSGSVGQSSESSSSSQSSMKEKGGAVDKDGNTSTPLSDFAMYLMKFEDLLSDGDPEDEATKSHQTSFKIQKTHLIRVLKKYQDRNKNVAEYLLEKHKKIEQSMYEDHMCSCCRPGSCSCCSDDDADGPLLQQFSTTSKKNQQADTPTHSEEDAKFEEFHQQKHDIFTYRFALEAEKYAGLVIALLDANVSLGDTKYMLKPEHMDLPLWRNRSCKELTSSLRAMGLQPSEAVNSVRKVIQDLKPASAKERSGIHWVFIKHVIREITVQLMVLVVLPVFTTLAVASICQHVYSISDGAAEWPQSGQECFFGQERNVIPNFPSDGIVLSRTYDDPVRPGEGPHSGLYIGVQYLIFGVLGLAIAMAARIFFLDQIHVWIRRAIGRSKGAVSRSWHTHLGDTFIWLLVKLFAIAMMLYTFLCCSWFGIFAIWTAFAAILDPEKNLAKGIILVVVVTVVWRAIKKLISLRSYVKDLTNARTDAVLTKKVDNCLNTNKGVSLFKLKSLDDKDDGAINLEALFAHVMDKHANIGQPRTSKEESTLNFEQFVQLFVELKMTIPLEKLQRMFAFCDEDNNGKMTTEEFQNAWEYLRETVAQVMMVKLGLDDSSIIKHITYFLLCFSICIPLFLLMIALWDQSSSFVSVTQSFFIGATGVFASNRTDEDHKVVTESKSAGSRAGTEKEIKKGSSNQDRLTKRIDNVISRFMS